MADSVDLAVSASPTKEDGPKTPEGRSPSPRRERSPSPAAAAAAASVAKEEGETERKKSASPKRRSPRRSPARNGRGGGGGSKSRGSEPAPPNRVLGIFGLNPETRESTITDFFNKYGETERIELVPDRRSGRNKGFGFIYFKHMEDAEKAKNDCDKLILDGRSVRVDYSLTSRPHNPTPGVYMGRVSPPPRGSRRSRSPRRSPRRRSRSPRRRSRSPRRHSRSPRRRSSRSRSRSPHRHRRSRSRSPNRHSRSRR